MAEVAACVLHNVGNVLNSVNISASLVSDGVRKSKIESVSRVAGLLEEHEPDLGHFITSDPRGRQLPGYLRQLSAHLSEEQSRAVAEMESLQKNIDHIKDIVARQQSYAKVSGVSEVVQIVELVEDSLQMNSGAMENHRVEIIRDYQEVPPLTVQKHKVLQILVNLLRNARHACDDRGHHDRQLTVRVAPAGPMVRISVSDNGIGILPENLTRIFSYGFTTRKEGHGFGLHGSALAAQEMGGTLRAHSDGPGTGATFTLELPVSFTRGETRTLSPETNREKTPMQRLMAAALQASDSLSLS
jgi:signal transduction histidine kinase